MSRSTSIGRQAWLALLKGVRAAHLYSADHGEVERWVDEFVRLLAEAGGRRPLRFLFEAGRVSLAGEVLLDPVQDRLPLLDRLSADGVRSFVFQPGFEATTGLRLLRLLAPYAYPDRAPLQPLSDRLHREAFDGLTIQIQPDEDAAGLGLDVPTGRERWWRETLSASDRSVELPRAALEPVWDGTRGRIGWPPGPTRELEALYAEVDEALAHRAGVRRVGECLAAAVRAWQDEPDVDRLLLPLAGLVRQQLLRGRPGDAGLLLGPLLRWAGSERGPGWRETLRDRVLALGGVLLAEDNLQVLARQVQDERVAPEDLVAWFQPLPMEDLAGVLSFASILPQGDSRHALVGSCSALVGERSVLLRRALLSGRPGPALVAFEVLERLAMSRETVGLALEALAAGPPPVVVRAIGYVLALRSRTIAGRLVPLLRSEVAEVRSGALTYMARYAYRPAFDPIRDFTEGGLFGGLPLTQRLEVCRTLGIVGGEEAERVARSHLPTGWTRLDHDRSLPWVVCLAASGSPFAPDFLEPAMSSGPEAHRSIARDAHRLWRQRTDTRGIPAPPVRTAPGAPVPVPLTDPGLSITDGLTAPRRWSHRASLQSGQWNATEEPWAEEEDR